MVKVPLQRALNTKDDQKPKRTGVLLKKKKCIDPPCCSLWPERCNGRLGEPSCEAEDGQSGGPGGWQSIEPFGDGK